MIPPPATGARCATGDKRDARDRRLETCLRSCGGVWRPTLRAAALSAETNSPARSFELGFGLLLVSPMQACATKPWGVLVLARIAAVRLRGAGVRAPTSLPAPGGDGLRRPGVSRRLIRREPRHARSSRLSARRQLSCSIVIEAATGCVPPASGVIVSAVEFPVGFTTEMTELMTVVVTRASPAI